MSVFRGRNRFDYDLVLVGGGSVGLVAGGVAGALGARVAIVERSRLGGECSWTGCVPSKALLHAADVAHTLRRAGQVGFADVALSREQCDGAFEYARRKVIEASRASGSGDTLREMGVDVFYETGAFVHKHLFRTDKRDLKAGAFLLATGSRPRIPDIAGLHEAGFLTNQTLFDLQAVPRSMVFIGGGYIACEMGQALARLGSRVTVLARDERLLPREDAEAVAPLVETLRADGVEIVTQAKVSAVRKEGDERVVTYTTANGETATVQAEQVMVATGRQANSEGLNLAEVGVTCDAKGNVQTEENGRTQAPTVWACGDVTGRFQFSHMAEHEAKVIVGNALFGTRQAVPYTIVPWATFTDPEMARVGLTEAEAIAKFGANRVHVFRAPFAKDDRAIVENQTRGLVKVVTVGATGKIVGACITGPQAGELIHEWVLAMKHNLPVRAIADTIHVYPTLSLSNQRAAQHWYSDLLARPVVQHGLRTLFNFTPSGKGL